jgi:hypothetical protein
MGYRTKVEAFEIRFSPTGTSEKLSKSFRTKRITQFVVHDENPPAIGMLVDVVCPFTLSQSEAFSSECPDPLPRSTVFELIDHAKTPTVRGAFLIV